MQVSQKSFKEAEVSSFMNFTYIFQSFHVEGVIDWSRILILKLNFVPNFKDLSCSLGARAEVFVLLKISGRRIHVKSVKKSTNSKMKINL